jgi:hypothetical protein
VKQQHDAQRDLYFASHFVAITKEKLELDIRTVAWRSIISVPSNSTWNYFKCYHTTIENVAIGWNFGVKCKKFAVLEMYRCYWKRCSKVYPHFIVVTYICYSLALHIETFEKLSLITCWRSFLLKGRHVNSSWPLSLVVRPACAYYGVVVLRNCLWPHIVKSHVTCLSDHFAITLSAI